jgi:hypothetical protein
MLFMKSLSSVGDRRDPVERLKMKKFSFLLHARFIALCKNRPRSVLNDSVALTSEPRRTIMTFKTNRSCCYEVQFDAVF